MARVGRFIRGRTISDAWHRGLNRIWRQCKDIRQDYTLQQDHEIRYLYAFRKSVVGVFQSLINFPMIQIVSIDPIGLFLARIILAHAHLQQHKHVYLSLCRPSAPYENRDLNNCMHRRSLGAHACKILGSTLWLYNNKLCTSRTFSSASQRNSRP